VKVAIVRASPDRLDIIASVLGRSFVVEPMLKWSLGAHGDVAERFTRHFACFLEELIPHGMVWEAGMGEGAAVWIPPDRADEWYEAQARDPRVDELTLDGGRRFYAFWEWIASRIPDERLWHLDSVAVDPDARGRGIGSALIEHGLAMAREDGLGAVLETANPRNVGYCESLGFHVVDEDHAPDHGPRVRFMRRDP
jgi:ribosomal protein S18 acetylase RimI-like enzyme